MRLTIRAQKTRFAEGFCPPRTKMAWGPTQQAPRPRVRVQPSCTPIPPASREEFANSCPRHPSLVGGCPCPPPPSQSGGVLPLKVPEDSSHPPPGSIERIALEWLTSEFFRRLLEGLPGLQAVVILDRFMALLSARVMLPSGVVIQRLKDAGLIKQVSKTLPKGKQDGAWNWGWVKVTPDPENRSMTRISVPVTLSPSRNLRLHKLRRPLHGALGGLDYVGSADESLVWHADGNSLHPGHLKPGWWISDLSVARGSLLDWQINWLKTTLEGIQAEVAERVTDALGVDYEPEMTLHEAEIALDVAEKPGLGAVIARNAKLSPVHRDNSRKSPHGFLHHMALMERSTPRWEPKGPGDAACWVAETTAFVRAYRKRPDGGGDDYGGSSIESQHDALIRIECAYGPEGIKKICPPLAPEHRAPRRSRRELISRAMLLVDLLPTEDDFVADRWLRAVEHYGGDQSEAELDLHDAYRAHMDEEGVDKLPFLRRTVAALVRDLRRHAELLLRDLSSDPLQSGAHGSWLDLVLALRGPQAAELLDLLVEGGVVTTAEFKRRRGGPNRLGRLANTGVFIREMKGWYVLAGFYRAAAKELAANPDLLDLARGLLLPIGQDSKGRVRHATKKNLLDLPGLLLDGGSLPDSTKKIARNLRDTIPGLLAARSLRPTKLGRHLLDDYRTLAVLDKLQPPTALPQPKRTPKPTSARSRSRRRPMWDRTDSLRAEGHLLRSNGMFETAEAVLSRALALRTTWEALVARGHTRWERGDWWGAHDDFGSALELSPSHPDSGKVRKAHAAALQKIMSLPNAPDPP